LKICSALGCFAQIAFSRELKETHLQKAAGDRGLRWPVGVPGKRMKQLVEDDSAAARSYGGRRLQDH